MSENEKDHERVLLRDVAAPFDGAFVDGPFGSNLKSDEYVDSGVRLIQLQNIGEGYWKDNNKKYITDQKFRSLSRHGAVPGDIAIAKMADPVARACIVPLGNDQYVVVADCIRLRVDELRFDPRYVVRAINSRATRAEAEKKSIGSTRIRINLGTLKTVGCLVPPLFQQRVIADILDTLDTTIHQTEAIIEKLKLVKQGLLHDLLTRGIDDNGELRPRQNEAPHLYKQSPLGWIPVKWRCDTLPALALGGLMNGVFKEPQRVGSGVPLVNVADLYRGQHVDLLGCEKFAATNAEIQRFGAQRGDIFFTRSSLKLDGIAQTSFLDDDPQGAVFECHVMRLRPNPTVVQPRFLKEWCVAHHARAHFMGHAKQVTMTTISQDGIRSLQCPVPPTAEQLEAVRRITAVDQRISGEAKHLTKSRLLKSGLMEDLLTGRVRVTLLLEAATPA